MNRRFKRTKTDAIGLVLRQKHDRSVKMLYARFGVFINEEYD